MTGGCRWDRRRPRERRSAGPFTDWRVRQPNRRPNRPGNGSPGRLPNVAANRWPNVAANRSPNVPPARLPNVPPARLPNVPPGRLPNVPANRREFRRHTSRARRPREGNLRAFRASHPQRMYGQATEPSGEWPRTPRGSESRRRNTPPHAPWHRPEPRGAVRRPGRNPTRPRTSGDTGADRPSQPALLLPRRAFVRPRVREVRTWQRRRARTQARRGLSRLGRRPRARLPERLPGFRQRR